MLYLILFLYYFFFCQVAGHMSTTLHVLTAVNYSDPVPQHQMTQQAKLCKEAAIQVTNFRARVHWPLCSTTCGRVFVAGIFIPVGNHYFQALASTLQFVAQVCDRLWLVRATDRAFAYITYMSPPHVALVCSDPPQCAATCGWTKWPVCSGPYTKCQKRSKLSK